ncbi:HAD family hydrolase [Candidatus Microgenomates bacterium]|nr:HAD family hydrolase [Candidatus Microgenomates bacterium]
MLKKYIIFDFAGTIVKMRPAKLLVKKELLLKISTKYNLGIITGAKKTETMNILSKLGINKLFSTIITSEDSILKKPNPKLFPILPIIAYVGDTKKDFYFAKNAGITFFRVNKCCNINQILERMYEEK